MITLDSLSDLASIRHGFLTRQGGVSEGLYASLNCGFGSGDQRERVAENRMRAARRVGADPENGVIGAAHAGWKGTLACVLEATLDAMIGLGAGAANIRAAIGPAIQQASYEVGPEFPAPFLAQDAASADYFIPAPRTGHFLLDLPGYVEARLKRYGIATLSRSPLDTLREEDRFFSYRRTCLRGERDYGRGLSIISLLP